MSSGWDESASAWIRSIDRGDMNRKLLLDHVVMELCGELAGKSVLDIGCGEGRFCRMLAAKGALTTGIDATAAMVEAALERDSVGRYLQASAEALPFLDGSFDLAVQYLMLIDVPDFRKAIFEAARVLRPGGRLVVVNILSFRTAVATGWICDETGYVHVPVDDYFTEKANRAEWAGISIVNYHRPAEAYFSAFIDAGLRLAAYREPQATPEDVAIHPNAITEARVPLFNVMGWEKGTSR